MAQGSKMAMAEVIEVASDEFFCTSSNVALKTFVAFATLTLSLLQSVGQRIVYAVCDPHLKACSRR